MIFVTGASRSGTTMLSRILGQHSAVLGLRELHCFGDLCQPQEIHTPLSPAAAETLAAALFARQERFLWDARPDDQDRDRARAALDGLTPLDAAGVYARVLMSLARDAGKQLACDQTPRYIFYADVLLETYRDARIVHMVRDPRDVLASQKNRWRLKGLGTRHMPLHEVARTWINYHPLTMAKLWRSANREGLRLAEHPRFLLMRFEDMVADPRRYVGELCAFLDIPFEPEMLDIPHWTSSHGGSGGDRQGISRDAVDKWQGTLRRGEISICESVNGDLMRRFDYPPSGPSAPAWRLLPELAAYPVHLAGMALINPRRAWIHARALLGQNRPPKSDPAKA